MDVPRLASIVGLMVAPTAVVWAVFNAPRAVRAVSSAMAEAEARDRPRTLPIEQVAADLRRLLVEHDRVKSSAGVAMRVHHLQALEAAITDCAAEAARALGVGLPSRPASGGLPRPQLHRLLHALVQAGLVLPPSVDLLASA